MKRLLTILCVMVAGSITLKAQSGLSIIDSVLFKTSDARDIPSYRVFGVSGYCTDGFDPEHEVLVPAFPPSFYIAFTSEHLKPFGEPRIYEDLMQNDCRGIPDSVVNDEATRFSVNYELGFKSNIGKVSIVFPQRLAQGIDSIHIKDVEGLGNVFNYTYANGRGTTFTIENDGVHLVFLTVYYNLRAASVRSQFPAIAEGMQLIPNPATTGKTVRLHGEVPGGARLIVSDMLGRMVGSQSVTESTHGLDIQTDALSAGLYIARVIDEHGAVLYSGRLSLVK